jgi:hypothetical protein
MEKLISFGAFDPVHFTEQEQKLFGISQLNFNHTMANRLFLPTLTPSARAADPQWNAKLSAKDELGELERAEKAQRDSVSLRVSVSVLTT